MSAIESRFAMAGGPPAGNLLNTSGQIPLRSLPVARPPCRADFVAATDSPKLSDSPSRPPGIHNQVPLDPGDRGVPLQDWLSILILRRSAHCVTQRLCHHVRWCFFQPQVVRSSKGVLRVSQRSENRNAPPSRFTDSRSQRAQQLVDQAFDTQDPHRQAALARQALEICPDCADAYFILANLACRLPKRNCRSSNTP